MEEMRYRQVHLDFHTCGEIPGVGSRFDKAQFQRALRLGHVDSITLFSKCHHGYSYHPTAVGVQHPGLTFDLLGAQLEACAEIGVRAPVYVSAGWDEYYAREHTEDILRSAPGEGQNFLVPGYHLLCYNTPYLERLTAQVEEVMERYRPCGIFLDISAVRPCYCNRCLAEMRRTGLDPLDPADVQRQAERVYRRYAERMERAVHRYDPRATLFHNAGNLDRGRRDLAHANTHLELESLPTGVWGYDHFPLSAAYARTLGMEFLGMTGKFHRMWGEFGGFKHPNALRYETALSVAMGVRCSVGDQLHPLGEMDESTYRLIGAAYREIEEKEPWLRGSRTVSDVAVLSAVAVNGRDEINDRRDVGACRVLLETHRLFDFVDTEADLTPYKLVILPDAIRLDETLRQRLIAYREQGGRLLLTGRSGLWADREALALEVGARFEGVSPLERGYLIPEYEAVNGRTAYVVYAPTYRIAATGGQVAAQLRDPYFNRTYAHFCSHQHAPDQPGTERPGAILTADTAYVAFDAFEDYAHNGAYYVRELLHHLIEALIGDRASAVAGLPDRGILTLRQQPEQRRTVAHLLFTYTSVRGDGVEVIEDVVPLREVPLTVRLAQPPRRVYLAPSGEELSYVWDGQMTTVTVPSVELHQMVVFDQ